MPAQNLRATTVLYLFFLSLYLCLPAQGSTVYPHPRWELWMDHGVEYRTLLEANVSESKLVIHVPSAGLLSVQLRGPGATRAQLGLKTLKTLRQASLQPTLVERQQDQLLSWLPAAGTYTFQLKASSSQSRPLALRTLFLDMPQPSFGLRGGEDEEEIEIDPGGVNNHQGATYLRGGEDEEEIEIDPGGVNNCHGPILTRGGEDEEEIEIDPGGVNNHPVPTFCRGGEDEEEIEIDPGGTPKTALAALCRDLAGSSTDDHSDSLTCASTLGNETVDAQIRNPWGDDVDVFRFQLPASRHTSHWSVALSCGGEVECDLQVVDDRGNRLATVPLTSNPSTGEHSLMLAPGTYFVRVQSRHGDEGSYRLSLASSPW